MSHEAQEEEQEAFVMNNAEVTLDLSSLNLISVAGTCWDGAPSRGCPFQGEIRKNIWVFNKSLMDSWRKKTGFSQRTSDWIGGIPFVVFSTEWTGQNCNETCHKEISILKKVYFSFCQDGELEWIYFASILCYFQMYVMREFYLEGWIWCGK